MNLKPILYLILACFWFFLMRVDPICPATHEPIVLWPDSEIPYVITGNFTEEQKKILIRTITRVNLFVPVKFKYLKDLEDSNKTYLNITYTAEKGLCGSTTGYKLGPKKNVMFLNPEFCLHLHQVTFLYGPVVHEIGHVYGLVHPHQLPNRDDYLLVNLTNIKEDGLRDFEKVENSGAVNDDGRELDLGSILTYPFNTAFVKDPRYPVFAAKNPQDPNIANMGQRTFFSTQDLNKIATAYHHPGDHSCLIDGNESLPLGESHSYSSCPKNQIFIGSTRQTCYWNRVLSGSESYCLETSPNLTYTNFDDGTAFQMFHQPRNWKVLEAKDFVSWHITGDFTTDQPKGKVITVRVTHQPEALKTKRWWPLYSSYRDYRDNYFVIEFACFLVQPEEFIHKFKLYLIAEVYERNEDGSAEYETKQLVDNTEFLGLYENDQWLFKKFTIIFGKNYTAGSKVRFSFQPTGRKDVKWQWLALDNVRIQRNDSADGTTKWVF